MYLHGASCWGGTRTHLRIPVVMNAVMSLTSTAGSSSAVAQSLRQDKARLKREVLQLAEYTLSRLLPRDYSFQESGSFWSYLVEDVTDIDLMFMRGQAAASSHVSLHEAELLQSAAERVLQFTANYRLVFLQPGGSPVELELSSWDSCRKQMKVRACHSSLCVAAKLPRGARSAQCPVDVSCPCATERPVERPLGALSFESVLEA